jgi:cytoskeletal protein CcmA (bactofilin family)
MKTEKISETGTTDRFYQGKQYSEKVLSGNGSLALNGDLEITGAFTGMLTLNGTLTVDRDARFTGYLIVTHLIVYGQIAGTADVSRSATFHDGSRFSGSLTASEATIHEGSRVSGIRKIRLAATESKPMMEPVTTLTVQSTESESTGFVSETVMPGRETPLFKI